MSLTLLNKDVIIPDDNVSYTKSDLEMMKNSTGAEYISNNIKNRYDSQTDKIVLVKSGTGTGKSTVFPTKLYELFKHYNKKILIAEPTVATAMQIPQDIAKYSNNTIEFGKNISYITGDFKSDYIKQGLEFCTYGILKNKLLNMTPVEFNNMYSVVIIDEAHYKSIDIDFILLYIKMNIKHESPVTVLMSGTLDVESYMSYYNLSLSDIITVRPGDSFPITDIFPKKDIIDIYSYIKSTIIDIHLNNPSDGDNGDILIFCYGVKAIKDCFTLISKINQEFIKAGISVIMPVEVTSSSMSSKGDVARHLIEKISSFKYEIDKVKYVPSRRIILATNAVETGLTVASLKYCIDTGYVKEISYNPLCDMNIEIIKNATRNSMIQRRGRVGRVHPGVWYPCYSEDVFNSVITTNPRENVTSDISELVLSTMISNTNLNDLIIPPPVHMVLNAMNNLLMTGLINIKDNKPVVSPYGELASKFRININDAAFILYGYKFKACIEDIITIIAFQNNILELYNVQLVKGDTYQGIINLWRDMITSKLNIETWCTKKDIKIQGLINVITYRENILTALQDNNLYISEHNVDEKLDDIYWDKIRNAAYYAYPSKIAVKANNGYKYINTGNIVHIQSKVNYTVVLLPKPIYKYKGKKFIIENNNIIVDITSISPDIDLYGNFS